MQIKNSDGFSLYTVLIFIMIITSLFIFILLIVFYQKKTSIATDSNFKEYLNLRSAISNYITSSGTLSDSMLFVISTDTITIKRHQNVLTDQLIATGNHYNHNLTADIAVTPNDYFKNALTISKSNSRLVEAGNINIEGNILCANTKLTRRNIPGVSTYHRFINKDFLKQDKNIPVKLYKNINFDTLYYKLDFSRFEIINRNARIADLESSISPFLKINGNLEIDEDYNGKTIETVFVTGEVNITSIEKCKINKIISDSTITLKNCSNLEGINFISKNNIIFFDSKDLKNISALSSNNIEIENSNFNYPSFVAIQRDTSKNEKNTIIVDNSIINGTISLFTDFPSDKDNSYVHIKSNSVVKGYIYSEAKVELSGKLIGSLYTHQTRKYVKPTEYINWLADLNIDRKKLGYKYLLPTLMKNKNHYYIINEQFQKTD